MPPLSLDNTIITIKLNNMTIQEIKAKIGINGSLVLVRQTEEVEENGQKVEKPTDWCSHWDNDKRIRVTMHMDVYNQLKANREFGGLALKPAVQKTPTGKAPYTLYMVITPKNVLDSF